jgi:hypothetical protein
VGALEGTQRKLAMMSKQVETNGILAYAETFGLWLITAVLAFYEIVAVRSLIFDLYAHFLNWSGGKVHSSDTFLAVTLGNASIYVMVFVAIAVIIGGFEYHHKRIGDPQSQRVLL